MKRIKGISILVAVLVCLIAGVIPSWGKEKVEVAMILWRGMTEAEEGFQAQLKESPNYDFNFTVTDANQDKGELAKIIDGLDAKKYKVIYAFGTTVTKELQKKVKDTPIVFNIVARPVEAGIVKSWEHSGNNTTGASNAVPMASIFNTISKVIQIKKLGFLYNSKEANSVIQHDEIAQLQTKFAYELVASPIENEGNIPDAVQKLINAKVDAVLLPSDSLIKANADNIISPLNKKKIPTIASIPDMSRDNNALMGLGPDYFELGKIAAYKVLAILSGEKPDNIPSSPIDKMHITVNLATANELGVNFPVQILRMATAVKQ